MVAKIDQDLARQLEALGKRQGGVVKVEDLGEVVRALLASASGAVPPADLALYREVEALAAYIHNAKAEIAALRSEEIRSQYIASATDELDAIIGATETATNNILDCAEKLEEMAAELPPEQGRRLTEATTTIYEACNFQDITGQRISKVVKALKHIEERIDALVAAFGPELKAASAPAPKPDEVAPPSDTDLLNGPQLPEKAHDQAAIDALFNDS